MQIYFFLVYIFFKNTESYNILFKGQVSGQFPELSIPSILSYSSAEFTLLPFLLKPSLAYEHGRYMASVHMSQWACATYSTLHMCVCVLKVYACVPSSLLAIYYGLKRKDSSNKIFMSLLSKILPR